VFNSLQGQHFFSGFGAHILSYPEGTKGSFPGSKVVGISG
jgi:hypothetical protein